MEDGNEIFYLRLRGLPWASTIDDIRGFLQGVNICDGDDSIFIVTTDDGKRTGDALLKLPSSIDLENALKYHRNYMGNRYIEVLKSTKSDFDTHIERISPSDCDRVVRLRGLPYSCVERDVREFFNGLKIVPQGLVILRDKEGRCSGEAYVEFSSSDEVREALQRNREKIGNRFIEIFPCNRSEMNYLSSIEAVPLMSINCKPKKSLKITRRKYRSESEDEFSNEVRPRYPYSGYNGARYQFDSFRRLSDPPMLEKFIHMRGLPSNVRQEEIEDFFLPVIPIYISFFYTPHEHFNGECDVYFEFEEDVFHALKNNNKRIGRRYVEIFLAKRRTIKTLHKNGSYNQRPTDNSLRYSPPNLEYHDSKSFYQTQPYVSYPNMATSISNCPPYNDNPYLSSQDLPQNRIKVISYPDGTKSSSQQVTPTSQASFPQPTDYFPDSKQTPAATSTDTPESASSFQSESSNYPENYNAINSDKFYNFY